MRKYGAKRDINEAQIVAALRAAGASVQHLSAPGVPDLLVGFREQNYLMEVKQAKGKLTPTEQQFADDWRGQTVIVRCVDDALRVIGAVRR